MCKRRQDKIEINRTDDGLYFASMDYFNSSNGAFWCRIETANYKTTGGARRKMIQIADRFGIKTTYA